MTGGPPWDVSGDLYLAHLGHPGQLLPHDDKGQVVDGSADTTPVALKRLARTQPSCTHKAGYDNQGNVVDRVSVWSHQYGWSGETFSVTVTLCVCETAT